MICMYLHIFRHVWHIFILSGAFITSNLLISWNYQRGFPCSTTLQTTELSLDRQHSLCLERLVNGTMDCLVIFSSHVRASSHEILKFSMFIISPSKVSCHKDKLHPLHRHKWKMSQILIRKRWKMYRSCWNYSTILLFPSKLTTYTQYSAIFDSNVSADF